MTPNLDTPSFDGPGERPIPDGHSFALLLTHDVDRPYKTYQSLYYALGADDAAERRHHLASLLPGMNPYWQFENLMALEEDLGVRSAFYLLDEQRLFRDRPVREWLSMRGWQLYAGRYDLDDPRIRDVVATMDDGGWEVGLHGSYESYDDRERLAAEKAHAEAVVGHPVVGGRQHYLNLHIPETWRNQRDLGLRYDASLGSSDTYGFQHGYGLRRPFDDTFVAFPLTVMEQSLPDPGADYDASVGVVEDLLTEARDNRAVMTVLWHPRHFSDADFPGHVRLYRDMVQTALDMDAWVGPPRDFYQEAGLGEDEPTPTASPSD